MFSEGLWGCGTLKYLWGFNIHVILRRRPHDIYYQTMLFASIFLDHGCITIFANLFLINWWLKNKKNYCFVTDMSSTMSSYATLVVFMSLVALTMTSVQSGRRSDWYNYFQPPSSTSWGEWGDWEYCPEGTYAFAFQQKSESYRQWGDNSANNAIKLYCK